MKTRSLFGGALLAAGLCAQSATGQTVNWLASYVGAYAVDYADFNPFVSDYHGAPGNFAVSAVVPNASASATGNGQGLWVDASSTAGDYIGITYAFIAYFDVTGNGTLDVSWDLEAGQSWPFGFGGMSIWDATNNILLLSADKFGNPVGVQQVNVSPGIVYYVQGTVEAYAADGSSYFHMVIPSPGSAGLLALVGLAAARRRR